MTTATYFLLRSDGLSWRVIDDEIVVLDVVGGVYLAGNRTAALLWEMVARGATTEELVRGLVDGFDVDPTTASNDVDRFVHQLRQRGLLAEA